MRHSARSAVTHSLLVHPWTRTFGAEVTSRDARRVFPLHRPFPGGRVLAARATTAVGRQLAARARFHGAPPQTPFNESLAVPVPQDLSARRTWPGSGSPGSGRSAFLHLPGDRDSRAQSSSLYKSDGQQRDFGAAAESCRKLTFQGAPRKYALIDIIKIMSCKLLRRESRTELGRPA